MMQLARPQSGLTQPYLPYSLHDFLSPCFPASVTITGLVMCLPADANVAASPGNAQPRDEVLREDLPEGFFTTRTP